MEQLELLPDVSTPAPVFIPFFDADFRDDYLKLAANLRAAGIKTEVYPEPKKLGAQLKYADRQGHKIAIIAGGNEWNEGKVQVKVLATKETQDVAYDHEQVKELEVRIRELL